jgi:hypothetical protein
MKKLVNLTPHAITVSTGEITMTFPPSGDAARVDTKNTVESPIVVSQFSNHDLEISVPLNTVTTFGVIGLPEPEENVMYIVSAMVAQQCLHRTDVIAPDTGPTAIRYTDGPMKGQIEAVRGFVRYANISWYENEPFGDEVDPDDFDLDMINKIWSKMSKIDNASNVDNNMKKGKK